MNVSETQPFKLYLGLVPRVQPTLVDMLPLVVHINFILFPFRYHILLGRLPLILQIRIKDFSFLGSKGKRIKVLTTST